MPRKLRLDDEGHFAGSREVVEFGGVIAEWEWKFGPDTDAGLADLLECILWNSCVWDCRKEHFGCAGSSESSSRGYLPR
jgi:hypothetical protein